MKVAKGIVLAIALFAIVLTIVPLTSQAQVELALVEGGGNYFWTVTCNYNGQDKLVSWSCTPGGTEACVCP